MTSWRAGSPPKKNQEDFKNLQQDIRSKGKGFFHMKGRWQECQAEVGPDEYRKATGSCPDGWHHDSKANKCVKADPHAKDKVSLPYAQCPPEQTKLSEEP